MEYCEGGDLSTFIKTNGPLKESTTRRFFRHLALGLQALRKENIIHRDLKPHNLLLTEESDNAILKIADFGLAKTVENDLMSNTICGTPLYMAPEIQNKEEYGPSADLWSVGTILYEMVMGIPPYKGSNVEELKSNIQNGNVVFPEVSSNCSAECIDLMKRLLQVDPNQRITFEEFFNHPFLHQDDTGIESALSHLVFSDKDGQVDKYEKQDRLDKQNKKDTISNNDKLDFYDKMDEYDKENIDKQDKQDKNDKLQSVNSENNVASPSDNILVKPKKGNIFPFSEEKVVSLLKENPLNPTDNSFISDNNSSFHHNNPDLYNDFIFVNQSPPQKFNGMSPPSLSHLPENGLEIVEKYLSEVNLEKLIQPNQIVAKFPETILDFSQFHYESQDESDIEKLEERSRRAWAIAEAAYLYSAQQKYDRSFIVYTKSLELLYNTLLRIKPEIECDRTDVLQYWIKKRFDYVLQKAKEVKSQIQAVQWEMEVDCGEKYIYEFMIRLAQESARAEYLDKFDREESKLRLIIYERCLLLINYLYDDKAESLERNDIEELSKMRQLIQKHCTYLKKNII